MVALFTLRINWTMTHIRTERPTDLIFSQYFPFLSPFFSSPGTQSETSNILMANRIGVDMPPSQVSSTHSRLVPVSRSPTAQLTTQLRNRETPIEYRPTSTNQSCAWRRDASCIVNIHSLHWRPNPVTYCSGYVPPGDHPRHRSNPGIRRASRQLDGKGEHCSHSRSFCSREHLGIRYCWTRTIESDERY